MKFFVLLFYLFINFFIHNIICNDAQQLIKTCKTENDVISNITDFYSQNENILIDKKTSLKIKELLLEKKYYTSLSLYFYISALTMLNCINDRYSCKCCMTISNKWCFINQSFIELIN